MKLRAVQRTRKQSKKKGLNTFTGQSSIEQSEEQAECKAAQEFPQQLLWEQGKEGTCPVLSRAWLSGTLGAVHAAGVTFAEGVQAAAPGARHHALTQCTDCPGPRVIPLPRASCWNVLLPVLGMDTILAIYIDDNLLISTYVNIITHGLPSQKISWIKGNLIVLSNLQTDAAC